MTISVKSIAVERLGCNATSNIGNNVRHAINKRNLIEYVKTKVFCHYVILCIK